jgi:hypothetical protein
MSDRRFSLFVDDAWTCSVYPDTAGEFRSREEALAQHVRNLRGLRAEVARAIRLTSAKHRRASKKGKAK